MGTKGSQNLSKDILHLYIYILVPYKFYYIKPCVSNYGFGERATTFCKVLLNSYAKTFDSYY